MKLPVETVSLKKSSLPGYVLATQQCLLCHSADLIAQQPPSMTLAQWTAEVAKMQHAYGATFSPDDSAPLSEYLAITYGAAHRNESTGNKISTADKKPPTALALLTAHACLGCHAINEVKIGPSYRRVAERYGNLPAAEATIAASIRSGSTGKWGTAAMPAYPNLTSEDLKKLARFVLQNGG